MSQQGGVYFEQNSGDLVAPAGSKIRVAGTITPANGTQATAISDITVTGTYANDDDAIETAVNSILAALRNAGIVASS